MATTGISRSGLPEVAPAGLAAAKAKSNPSPGGAKWTKGDPQTGALGASGIPGIPPLRQSEGTRGIRRAGDRPSAAPRGASAPGAGRSRLAQRSAAGSIPGRRRSAHCANPAGPACPTRPLLLEPGRRAWTPRASTGGWKCNSLPLRLDPLLGPPGFCPQS
nr:collagen alpha-1(I) chain [Microcebus murinus]